MKTLSKQSVFSLQTLILLSALVAVDAGSAALTQSHMIVPVEAASAEAPKAVNSHNHRCVVWASCNGQRQAVRFNHKNALLLAVAGLQQGL